MIRERADQARALGQSLWYDNISRAMLQSGQLARLIDGGIVTGITTNPTIFQKAMVGTDAYEPQIDARIAAGSDTESIYHALTLADVREAADLLRGVWDRTQGADGYVSLEVLPRLAHDRDSTVTEALRLHEELDRPNTMIKVPGTPDGVEAFEELTSRGVNVNVTLLFSLKQYERIAKAWIEGLKRLHAGGGDVSKVASVASFFVSRVDSAVDAGLEKWSEGRDAAAAAPALAARGETGIANCRVVYRRFKEIFAAKDFAELAAAGARTQRVLWASTSTKNPDYPDTLYLDALLGPDTVNTVPPATLDAFLDHGRAEVATIEQDLEAAEQRLASLAGFGVDLDAVCEKLQTDGVRAFAKSFDELLAALGEKVETRRQSSAS